MRGRQVLYWLVGETFPRHPVVRDGDLPVSLVVDLVNWLGSPPLVEIYPGFSCFMMLLGQLSYAIKNMSSESWRSTYKTENISTEHSEALDQWEPSNVGARPMRILDISRLVCIGWEVERSCPQNQSIEVLQFVREKVFSKEKPGAVPKIIENLRSFEWQLVNINLKRSWIRWLEEHCI